MGPAKESKIDFFIIDVELAKAVKEVTVREEVTFHPHRPVLVKFAEKPADMRYLAFDEPPKLPTEKFVGPRQHGERSWGAIWEGYEEFVKEELEGTNPKQPS